MVRICFLIIADINGICYNDCAINNNLEEILVMVEFRSKLDSSKSRALNNNMFKKLLWLYALLTVFIIAFGVAGIVFREDSSDFAAGIGLIVLGVLVTPIGYFLSRFLQKRIDNSATYISDNTDRKSVV